MPDMNREQAGAIMRDFARLTGLDPPLEMPNRYLWTDAFAVCNYLGLWQDTGNDHLRDLALRLIDQVHHTLGRHRGDDQRTGWISGLAGEEGERHPTTGGLRIGKRLPERLQGEPADERLEWDQDGQYYHYLTKWMHALVLAGRATGDFRYPRWAAELAMTASARFIHGARSGGPERMYWKMSIDLTRPLVSSMGQHDPLDGLVTCCEIQLAASKHPVPQALPDLRGEISRLARICDGMDLATDDPLGTGGLLSDALRIAQVTVEGGRGIPGRLPTDIDLRGLLGEVLDASLFGLDAFADSGCTGLPADFRLAFRELGLAIGLSGVDPLERLIHGNPALFGPDSSLQVQAEALSSYLPLGETVPRFWEDGKNQESASWREHREINMVMLATSLAPGGFLGI